jgi:putative membrane protein
VSQPDPSGPAASGVDRSHPDYRFSLANERTFLAWVRTALALLAAGIGVVNLPAGFSSSAGRHILGVLLVVLGLFAAIGSYTRWRANNKAIAQGSPLPRSNSMPIVAGGVTVVGVIALILVIANA